MLDLKNNPSQGIGFKNNLWLIESFASRAALLGFVYFCVNFIYQLGYLSELGVNFGLFSLTKNFPVFENFFIAAYSFVIWGVLVETSGSTYDQIFGFFKPTSWRDDNTKNYRYYTLGGLLILYLILRSVYILLYRSVGGYSLLNWGATLNYYRVLLLLLSPSWEFISWSVTFFSVSFLIFIFFLVKRKYRRLRSSSLSQITDGNIGFMQIYINAISPAAALLSCLLVLIIIPSAVGRLTADIAIHDFRYKHIQAIYSIEMVDASSFCDIDLTQKGSIYYWKAKIIDNFTVHLLGKFGDFNVFVKINKQNKNNNIVYTVCLVDSSAIKTIVFPQDISY